MKTRVWAICFVLSLGLSACTSGPTFLFATSARVTDSLTVKTGSTMEATLNDASGTPGTTPANYSVSGSGKGTLAEHPAQAEHLSGHTYRLTWTAGEMLQGGDITITFSTSRGANGEPAVATLTHAGGAIGVLPTVAFTNTPADPTTQTSASFIFSGIDTGTPTSGIGRLECRQDAGAFATCTSPQNLSGLSEGAHSFSIRAIDQAGNTSTVVTHSWTIEPVLLVEGNFYHTCAVIQGAAKCWGSNISGELGDGSTTNHSSPVAVTGLSSDVQALTAGESHSCAVVNGGAKCWGSNAMGRLGDNSGSRQLTPVDVEGLGTGVSAIVAGWSHTCAIVNGGAKCWGNNTLGQLGDNSTAMRPIPVDVSGLGSGVSALAAGAQHTCAIVNGGAQCWGNNSNGQLGDNSLTNRQIPVSVSGLSTGVVALTAGDSSTCAILSDGSAKCWGNNALGQLGDGTGVDRLIPTQVSGLTSGVQLIRFGSSHACAVVNGGVKCWGGNGYGAMGNGTVAVGDSVGTRTPVNTTGLSTRVYGLSSGQDYSCAVINRGIKCWGRNSLGQIGDNTTTQRLTPVDVVGL